MNKPANDTAAIVPVINLNGTARETLLTEYEAVVSALNIAVSTYIAATCHPRDFQTFPDHMKVYDAFRAKRLQDLEQLAKIRANVEEILGGMLEQG